jgi:phosphatidate cytidylyltransferase
MPWHAVGVVILSVTFVVPLLGDVFALFVGSAIGGPKFCPAVSPKKTIAGSIGGLGGSILAAVVVYLLSTKLCNEETLKLLPVWWQYLLLGLIGGFVGQMGDLFASLVKRHCGLKDFSSIFPGHGGMLDRLDSVLFMAVLMYCYRLFFMTV